MRPLLWAVALLCTVPASAAERRPTRLTVLVAVDGLSAETLERSRPLLRAGGLAKMLREGATLVEAQSGHFFGSAAAGYATLSSGAYAYRHGITSERRYDRATGKLLPMLFDAGHPVLESPTRPDDDTSPESLFAESLADRVRLFTGGKGKALAIAEDDLAAVLLAGHLGQPYWLSDLTGRFVTSTYYSKELPAWVKAFNAKGLSDGYFGKAWDRARPEKEYLGLDALPFEGGPFGLGNVFPHPLTGKGDKVSAEFFSALTYSPMADELLTAFALQAIKDEELGKDDSPDFLAIAYGSPSRIARTYGPDSQEMADAIARLDKQLGDLLVGLDHGVGRERYVVAFTAPAGAGPVPEIIAQQGMSAGRIRAAQLQETMEKALVSRLGSSGPWVLAVSEPYVYLNVERLADKGLSPELAQNVAGQAAQGVHGMSGFFTAVQASQGRLPSTRSAVLQARGYFESRSGDLALWARPYFLWGPAAEKPEGSSSGSPYGYDTHVPLTFFGGGIRPSALSEEVDLSAVAPTLALLMKVGDPSAAEGRPLWSLLR